VTGAGTKIVTLGEILVEIVAEERGNGFREPVRLIGPFPSGAPAIFIDQVARLGQPCGIIGCVGEDDFGWVNLERLRRDGVDVRAVEVLAGYPTGSAFVRYRLNGERDFVYNINYSAAGQINLTEVGIALLQECRYLHISGASLFSDRAINLALRAVELVKGNGGLVSFDPNVRKEVMGNPDVLAALKVMLASCDLFFPSGDELTLLTDATTPEGALAEILDGTRAVVLKQGARGATYYGPEMGPLECPGYQVEEVDPTGAGDCFDATYIACRAQGRSVKESLDYANAAGALAVTVKGPMEGTSGFASLDALRSQRRRPTAARRRLADWLRPAMPTPGPTGVTSVCSAHPLVLEAAMREAASQGSAVLIEATCNQVNHQGGYTGLNPADFRDFVYGIAARVSFPRRRVLLGGDHLGPNPWRHLPPDEAMAQAELMVAAYVAAGFEKVHLDTSMGARGEPGYVPAALTAERAARLALVAEKVGAETGVTPRYVIGTEVPTPGGAKEEIEGLKPTRPEDLLATIEAHRQAFAALGAEAAFQRVMAVVAQPGVEFDDQKVVLYEGESANGLSAALSEVPELVFEAHSTDYQPADRLAQLVRDGFAILKVGPGLTFALRQALYGLDQIAGVLDQDWLGRSLMAEMERVMLADPKYWEPYYRGQPDKQHWLRHYSYSDRIRYYWPHPVARKAVQELLGFLSTKTIPAALVSQFLPALYPRVLTGHLPLRPRDLVIQSVRDVLRDYATACHQG
jgi:D-tagatose-bisphosphate aldolase class II non-catalytic subunit